MNFSFPGLKYRKLMCSALHLSVLRIFESLVVYLQRYISYVFTSVSPAPFFVSFMFEF